MNRLHMAWHWSWALIWAHLHWYGRAGAHLDRWFVLVDTEIGLEVFHPNEVRVGCRLVPVLASLDSMDRAAGSTSAFAPRPRWWRR